MEAVAEAKGGPAREDMIKDPRYHLEVSSGRPPVFGTLKPYAIGKGLRRLALVSALVKAYLQQLACTETETKG